MFESKYLMLDEAETLVWERAGQAAGDYQLSPIWHAIAEGRLVGDYWREGDRSRSTLDRRSAARINIWHPDRDAPQQGADWIPSTHIRFLREAIDKLWPNPRIIDGTAIERNRGGRPRLPWDDFFAEVIRIANEPDGLPETQAELERRMLDWCTEHWQHAPGESTVRTKVSDLYRSLRSGSKR